MLELPPLVLWVLPGFVSSLDLVDCHAHALRGLHQTSILDNQVGRDWRLTLVSLRSPLLVHLSPRLLHADLPGEQTINCPLL